MNINKKLNTSYYYITTLLVWCTALLSIIGCVATIKGSDTVAIDSSYEEGALDNGMKYFIYPTDIEPDKIMLQVTINAGSLYEEPNELGISHFLEHLAFNSTEKYTREDFQALEQSLGIGMGSHSNASTGYKTVNYYLSLQELSESRIESIFDILSQRTLHITFNSEEIEKERGVVLSEKLLSDTEPNYHQYMFVHNTILQGTTYLDRNPIGTEERINNVSLEEIQALYKKWYRPSRMAVIVVGDIDSEQIKPYLDRYFGSVTEPASDVKIPEVITTLSTKSTREYKGYYDPTIVSNRVEIFNSVVEEKNTSVNYYKQQLVNEALSVFVEEQFSKYVVYKNSDTALNSVGFYKFMYMEPNIYTNGTFIDITEDKLQEGLKEARFFLNNLSQQLKTPEALYQVQNHLDDIVNELSEYDYQQVEYIGSLLASHFIYDEPLINVPRTLKKYGDAIIDSVNNEDLVTLFDKSFYSEENTNVFLFVGDKHKEYIIDDGVSEDLALHSLFQKQTTEAIFYQQNDADEIDIDAILQSSLDELQTDTSQELIIEEHTNLVTNAITWKLSNGHTVIFNRVKSYDSSDTQLVVSTHNKSIAHNYLKKFPSINLILNNANDYAVVDGMLLTRLLEELSGEGAFTQTGTEIYIDTKDIEEVFMGIHLLYSKLQISEDNFIRAKYQALEEHKADINSPFAYTYFAMLNHITKNSEFFSNRIEESYINDITFNEFNEYMQAWLKSKDITFIITADSSAKKIKQYVKKWLAPLPTIEVGTYDLNKEVYDIESTDGTLALTRQDAEPIHLVFRAAATKFSPSKTIDSKHSTIAAIAGGYLQNYSETQIREELGETYFVNAGISYTIKPVPFLFFEVSFPSDPEKSSLLAQELDTALDAIVPIDKTQLENIKSVAVSRTYEDFASDIVDITHHYLYMNTIYGDPLITNEQDKIDAINAVTKEEVEALLQQVLDLPKISIISYPSTNLNTDEE